MALVPPQVFNQHSRIGDCGKTKYWILNHYIHQLLSSIPFGRSLALKPAAPLLAAAAFAVRSFVFVLSKLWKKFCKTSCWDCPAPGLGLPVLVADGGTGERTPLPLASEDEVPNGTSPAGRLALPVSFLVAGDPSIAVVGPAPIPLSISLRARSTLGRLKLLLPKGPTIPAEAPAKSAGFRKAPRGSLSDFFEFSS